ncbi:hypothetical protein IV500_16040 [Paeniglutamicibacter antarcticus]|uniref:Uncharacterized protein n=1 Tax=Arthrobacter terrae TaxID=2935737 RepID=A0A931CLQ2_9MICC|nr:hypothetical protein [Arthrobacter terrae]MBG0740887.1 hypothetical protein [Arthrobacter terrae]
MDIEQVLRGLGGAARTGTLLQLGVTAAQLVRAVRSRQVWQPGPDVLSIYGAPEEFVQAACQGGVLTCVSAAGQFGLWRVREPRQLHLAFPQQRRLGHEPCDEPDHERDNEPHDEPVGASVPGPSYSSFTPLRHPILHSRLTRPAAGPPVAALEDALIHALLCLPMPESVVLVESAVNRGLATTDLLRQTLLAGTDAATVRAGHALTALDLVHPGSSSALEVLARVVFRRFGFDVATQVWICGVGVVDFLIEGCLIVELAGPDVELHKSQFRADFCLELAAIAAGYALLRVPYTEAVNRPQLLSGRLRRALGEGRLLAG